MSRRKIFIKNYNGLFKIELEDGHVLSERQWGAQAHKAEEWARNWLSSYRESFDIVAVKDGDQREEDNAAPTGVQGAGE